MNPITDTVSSLAIGESKSVDQLAMVPLLRADSFELDYTTLEKATRDGRVTITETSVDGTVPELMLTNASDVAVLLLDGQELIGAKQNRIVNLTILAPAHSKLTIPVSCVEAGRWHQESSSFSVSDRAMFSRARARKSEDISASLIRSGDRTSRQGAVWEDIALKAAQMRCESPTQAMASLFDAHQEKLAKCVAALTPVTNQVGAAFLIKDELAGIEIFDHTATMASLMPDLVRSYALDAMDSDHTCAPVTPKTANVADMLSRLSSANTRTFAAVGEGDDIRLVDDTFTGGALAARDRLIHLCAFPKHQMMPSGHEDGGLARISFRRRAYH